MGKFDDILDEFENDLMEKEKINLVAFILDASGSMTGSEKFVCDTFNEQLKIAKEQKDQETLITMVSFSTDSFGKKHTLKMFFANRPVDKVEEITKWKCNGGTPLHDAVGNTIAKLRETVDQYPDRDISVLVNVITDGEENTSKEYKGKQIKEIVSDLEKEGNWSFTFLGADIDVFKEGRKMGMSGTSGGNTLSFSKSAAGFRGATAKMSNGNARFYSNRTAGIRNVSNFYGEDEKDDKKI
jgi:Mg-chelatase subunit ChlD